MFRLGTLFWMILVSATGFAMFAVKYGVQAFEEELARTKKAIVAEQHEIRVLDAEWAYLTRPETLEELNRRYLSLAPIATKQLHLTVTDIPLRPPPPVPEETAKAVADGATAVADNAAAVADIGPAVSPAPPVMPAPLIGPAAPVVQVATEKPAREKPVGGRSIGAPEIAAKPVPVKVAARPAVLRRPRSLDELIAQIAASR